jgi:hypothetical protein
VVLVVKNQIPTTPQPPNSPDVTLCDFQLLAKIKIGLIGHQVVCAEEIQQNATAGLTATPKQDFQRDLTTMVRPHEQVFVCRRTVFEG